VQRPSLFGDGPDYPDASHSGFQTHIFLAPGAVGTDSAPDYTLPNFDLPGHPKPGWRIRHGLLRYKINEPAETHSFTAAARWEMSRMPHYRHLVDDLQ